MKNQKKTTWVFFLYKYRKFLSISSEFKLERKLFILEVCLTNFLTISIFYALFTKKFIDHQQQ